MAPHIDQPDLILVDGSSYLFRAYHALPPLTNSRGEPTGAVYGIINMIRRLYKDYDPKYMAVVFDTKGTNFRHDMYPEYKANREAMPEELAVQIPFVHDIIRAMGIPLIAVEGVEADDVIGTLARQASEKSHHTLVSTGDKDFAQMVNDHVTLMNTMTNKFMDSKGVEEKFGVGPDRIIDYLALMGDTVDNVPGIPKVGPKTAAKWINEYGSLDEIVKNADHVKGKVGENLRSHLDQLALAKDLVTIRCDVDLESQPEDLVHLDVDKNKLRELYQRMEFRTWLAELGDGPVESKQEVETNYDVIFEQADFDAWLKKLKSAKLFAFDTETTSLNYMDAEVVGVSFSVKEHEAAYVPLTHDYEGAPKQLDRDKALQQLKPLLEDPAVKKVGQNLKYDKEVLANHDIDLQGIEHDTMLESYVLRSVGTRHDMDTLALKYLGRETIHFEDIAGKGAKQLRFDQIDIEQAGPYAAEDADITLQLHQKLFAELEPDKKLLSVYRDIEMPLLPVLAKIERTGVLVCESMLATHSKALTKRAGELESEIYQLAGEEFNISSPKQLQVILYEKLGLPALKKTPKGQPSTAENVLQELALDFPLPKYILEYRSIMKLKSTYVDALPEQINEKTGRVHTSYHQAVAATGRLSSSNPNLQNIPIRTEEGRKVRKAFVAPKGYQLLAADYSQIELRIMAHLSDDEGLLNAFSQGLDVHKATAAEIHGISIDEVTKDQRRNAKAVNFGLIYGMSAFGLAKQLGLTRQEAQEHIDIYFQQYPGVQQYMDDTRALAHKQGYVETLFGRRLYLPEINNRNKMMQQAAERTAINAPMQGTAADIIKRAMLNVDKSLSASKLDARMIMQVHDELVFECADKDMDALKELVNEAMTSAADLKVDLVVDMGIGSNWDDAH